jgi:hypothetical protein
MPLVEHATMTLAGQTPSCGGFESIRHLSRRLLLPAAGFAPNPERSTGICRSKIFLSATE